MCPPYALPPVRTALNSRLLGELGPASAPPRASACLFVALAGPAGGVAGALVAVRAARGAVARKVSAQVDPARGGALVLTVPPDAEATQPVLIVAQVWVAPPARRAGVAKALLDAARAHTVYAYAIPRDGLAFANPTADGYKLAAAYLGHPRVPVTDGRESDGLPALA
jgi:hypothetical protein